MSHQCVISDQTDSRVDVCVGSYPQWHSVDTPMHLIITKSHLFKIKPNESLEDRIVLFHTVIEVLYIIIIPHWKCDLHVYQLIKRLPFYEVRTDPPSHKIPAYFMQVLAWNINTVILSLYYFLQAATLTLSMETSLLVIWTW